MKITTETKKHGVYLDTAAFERGLAYAKETAK